MIKGFLPVSFIDWPGKVAAVIFLAGCNFRCPHCHNPVLAWEPHKLPDYPLEEILSRLEATRDWLDGVVITGGEPTIHKDLHRLIGNLGRTNVKLDTNGSDSWMLQKFIDYDMLRCVALDIKAPQRRYREVTGRVRPNLAEIERSVAILKESRSDIEVIFRTTLIPGLIGEPEIEEITEWLGERPVVQPFNSATNR